MAKRYFYKVDYHCTCEACGRAFSGIIKRGPLEFNESMTSAGIQVPVDATDMEESRERIQRAVQAGGKQPYVATNAEKCPYCGARQSWYPPEEPKKSNNIGCLIFTSFIGMCFGFLIWIAFFMQYDFIGPICSLVGLFLGLFPMAGLLKSGQASEEAEFAQKKAIFDAFTAELQARSVRNKPEIFWETARRDCID